MSAPHALDVLFLTNFSEYCFRAIPAIAQMADTVKVRLTIMNVYDPAVCKTAKAEAQLHSFFPEADRYPACHRIAVPGKVVDAVRKHIETWPVSLIVAPASDPIGLPRLGERSLRGRIMRECGVPLWTIGRGNHTAKLMQPVKNVACWLDFYSPDASHLTFAVEYAKKFHAKLHLLRALPEIEEGSQAFAWEPHMPLHPRAAAEQIRSLCRSASIQPEVHVTTGHGRSAVARLLKECDADVAFLPREQTAWSKWLGMGLHLGDSIPCPAIYVAGTPAIPVWNLEQRGARTGVTVKVPPVREEVAPRDGVLQPSWQPGLSLT